ncbi:MAG: hypothetical protein JWO81_1382 [Alphaproteobacteria bacterium]|nr:hypothetical protein [Alphaproteobacteria bacterium]
MRLSSGAWRRAIGGNAQEAAAAARSLADAHRALKADTSIQFNLQPAPAPPAPPLWLRSFFHELGHVLRPIGRGLDWIGSFMPNAPYAHIFLWTVLALAALALVALAVQRIRTGEWRLPRRRRAALSADAEEEPGWAPEAAPARAWLNEADALAGQGLYAEAVHHLLFRSVEDLAKRRPRLVRPALTSRELAAAEAVPPAARDLFARIARLVERSLFGGRAVDSGDWSAARMAYADFVLPRSWRA